MLLTKKEVASKLRVSVRTVDRMMRKGLPHLKYEYTVRFDWEKVVNWLEGAR